jgi:hypothetical protein
MIAPHIPPKLAHHAKHVRKKTWMANTKGKLTLLQRNAAMILQARGC